ncbi:MAG: EAL domain-containing protein [Rhodopseudomonas sp.]|uniref:bifunctional diguanylate cyclase/phosphodiesterase n=1 Tax=Rhodopseudomonas sp. TaxID=1078 RepID=UPI0017E61155|nr:EAL domain-containing protein [Rhodopseudomonas sp.]NVN85147.1 EAL domain-containing protein [Rhodopseudomonas sp.]
MTPHGSRPFRWVVVCGALLILAIAVGTATMIGHFRDRAIANSERELENTVSLLARHFDQQFEDLETIQSSLIDYMHAAGINSPDDYERKMSGRDVHLMLETKLSGLSYIGGLNLFDQNGTLINSSGFWPVPEVNVADRNYFKEFKFNPRSAAILVEPAYSRVTGAWTIILARKLVGPNGEFLGSIGRGVEPAYFEKFFSSLALGEGGAITMFHRDGTLLARHPSIEPIIGRNFKTGPLFQNVLSKASYGTTRLLSQLDGRDRLAAAQVLKRIPIVVAVTTTVSAALADSQQQTRFLVGMAGLFALVIFVMLLMIVRQLSQDHKTSRRKLAQEKQRLDIALNNMTQGLLLFDAAGRIVFCNRRYIEMYGLSRDVVTPGCSFRDLMAHRRDTGSFRGDVDDFCERVLHDLAVEQTTQIVIETVDGRSIQVVNEPLATGGWVVTHEDITERRKAESKLEKTQRLLNGVIEHMPAILSVKDVRTRTYLIVNQAASLLFGLRSEQMIGKTAHQLFEQSQSEYFDGHDSDAIRSGGISVVHEHTVTNRCRDTRVLTTTKLTIPDEAGAPEYLISFSEDITERRQAEAKISHLAHHDVLTGLANRMLLRERLETALSSGRQGVVQAVFYVDIDHFKSINDTFGHAMGDELLKAVAGRMSRCVSDVDTIARLGGDEFIIFLTSLKDASEAERFAQKILEIVGEPVQIGDRIIDVDLSIGISIAPNDATSSDQLLANADAALYEAKAAGRGRYCFFKREFDTKIKNKRILELNLRAALAKDEIEIHYQPIINLRDGRINGCEALLRWRHPEQGTISPADFIPVAEATGLINQLGDWVLNKACAEAATWPGDIRLAVNVSPIQFRSQTLALKVAAALASSGLSAGRLELEITEAVLIGDDEAALAMLHELREIGVRIALDDFGTGYSSLSYLQRFPFDKIKIDRCFIKDIAEPDGSSCIVQAVVNIAAARHMTTTAEGAETQQQRDILRQLGCTEMQGFLYSPAVPAAELARLLLARRDRAAGAT